MDKKYVYWVMKSNPDLIYNIIESNKRDYKVEILPSVIIEEINSSSGVDDNEMHEFTLVLNGYKKRIYGNMSPRSRGSYVLNMWKWKKDPLAHEPLPWKRVGNVLPEKSKFKPKSLVHTFGKDLLPSKIDVHRKDKPWQNRIKKNKKSKSKRKVCSCKK